MSVSPDWRMILTLAWLWTEPSLTILTGWDHEAGPGGRHDDVVGQHDQAGQAVPAGVHTVEQMTLVPLPDTQLVVLPQGDDTAGGVGDLGDGPHVGLDTVHAGPRQQVPHTQHPVLGGRPCRQRRVTVDEDTSDGP